MIADDRAALFDTEPTAGTESTLGVRLGKLALANPVMPASGCFGPELGALIPVREIGAIVTKTLFPVRRSGNPAHRLTETAHGMLNSVGIPSPGTAGFLDHVLPAYRDFAIPIIASVGGLTVDGYGQVIEELAEAGAEADIAAYEVNVSCPNLEKGGLAIGAHAATVERVVSLAAARTRVPLLVKLTPNVTDIGDIARAAEYAGATAVTVCNSFPGMAVDVASRKAVLGNTIGGLSGPAVKPLALRLVWQAASAVGIPVIGCGGISTARDVVEYLLAGATAVQVGTATFTRPYAMVEIVRNLDTLRAESGVPHIASFTGGLLPTDTPQENACAMPTTTR